MIRPIEKDMNGKDSKMIKGFPKFERLGVVSANEEPTPFVFKGKLYCMENFDNTIYAGSCKAELTRLLIEKYGNRSCAFIRDLETNEIICAVGEGAYFYSLYTDEKEKVYIFGTVTNGGNGWFGGDSVVIYESEDLINWTKRDFFTKKGWLMFNTSVTKDEDGYMLLVELQKPVEIVGPYHFTYMFGKTKDFKTVEWIEESLAYPQDRYAGGPKMHYVNGYYYVLQVTELPGPVYCTYLTRTKDFVNWQFGKYNPFMLVHPDDIKLAESHAPEMLPELMERIPYGFYISHSDIDFCEYNGKVIIDYAIGNQQGVWSYNCRAIYHGTLQEMLENFFE